MKADRPRTRINLIGEWFYLMLPTDDKGRVEIPFLCFDVAFRAIVHPWLILAAIVIHGLLWCYSLVWALRVVQAASSMTWSALLAAAVLLLSLERILRSRS